MRTLLASDPTLDREVRRLRRGYLRRSLSPCVAGIKALLRRAAAVCRPADGVAALQDRRP